MEIIITKANLQNTPTIAHFQVKMAMETENYKLDLNTVIKGVNAVFNNQELGQYYIAEINGETIASLLTTYEWSDWRNAKVLWIQSVYVLPKYRRKGIFTKFYEHIKTLAKKDSNIGGIRLYVDKTNTSAQKTYAKVGMNGEHYQLYEWMK